jgi:single-strand DNA-binding protein
MADLNSFTFTGRLTKDAQLKTLPTGKQLLEVNAAINTGYGNYKKTLFVKINLWGVRGEKIAGFLKKGGLVGVVGVLSKNVWQGNDGTEHSDLVVDAADLQMLSSKKTEAESESESSTDDDIAF